MENNKNIKLGLFVLLGTVFLIVAMYFIGAKQSLFSSTIRINAIFHTVDGLMPGNNVRFAGIDVGTVEAVEIQSDSSVLVRMRIEENSIKYIYKNAIASIGSDGLMGNKLVNISSAHTPSICIQDGDVLLSIQPLETNDLMHTLGRTNEDISAIAHNLRIMTDKINHSNLLWHLLSDSSLSQSIKSAIVNIQMTGANTAMLTGDLRQVFANVKKGKGSIGALLNDTVLQSKIEQTVVNIHFISDTLARVSGNLSQFSGQLNQKNGAIATLLMDTSFASDLKLSMRHIKNSSVGLDQNLEALKSSIFLKKYFRKTEKKKLSKP